MQTEAARQPSTRRRNSVLAALELFRGESPNLWLTNIVTFFYVCENEGINVKELAQIARLQEATASRCVRSLAPEGSPGALPPALGLVELKPNPMDGRGKILTLTPRGRELSDRIDEIIKAAVPIF